jgi:Histidine kinase-, DNA gyrase B-, and HSP90-like ATPase
MHLRAVGRTALVALSAAVGVVAATVEAGAVGTSSLIVVGSFVVGMAFVVAALFSPLDPWVRLLTAVPGLLWWLGSLAPALSQAYLWGLVVLLVSFPRSRPRSWAWLPVGLAVPAFAGQLERAMVAALFGVVAVVAAVGPAPRPARWWAAGSASAVAVVVGVAHFTEVIDPRAMHPRVAVEVLSLTLLVVAVTSLLAGRALDAAADRAALVALEGDGHAGIEGLEEVLRAATGDRTLTLAFPEPREGAPPVGRGVALLEVSCEAGGTAYVAHSPATLADAATRGAVERAVAQTARSLAVRQELERQTIQAEAARLRVLSARDGQREEVSARLREEVLPHVRAAEDALSCVPAVHDEIASVRTLLAVVGAELESTVAGAPPEGLGHGGLVTVLRDRLGQYDLPITLDADGWVGSDVATEVTLFFVCSEAVVNAIKHASANRVTVTLSRSGDEAVLSVVDDGRGGANPSGHGLTGLADRVAAHGGRLRVESPCGAGTSVTVVLPLISRSSSTA